VAEGPVECAGLVRARGVMGAGGDEGLWSAFVDEGVGVQPAYRVHAARLLAMLSILADASAKEADLPKLVWTLAPELGLPGLENSYSTTAISLVHSATNTLILVSPFMEAKGVGRLLESLLIALKRRVHVSVITH